MNVDNLERITSGVSSISVSIKQVYELIAKSFPYSDPAAKKSGISNIRLACEGKLRKKTRIIGVQVTQNA